MKAPPATTTETVQRLVAECLDRIEREGPTAVEEFLELHPEHAAAVRTRLEHLRDAGLLEAPASAEVRFPERLGPFRLIERIGGGGMGVVYLAEQEPLGRKVALKLVRPDLLYFEGARERFRREIEVVARLKHPGIVPVYTVGEEEGIPFYAMEHVEGRSLDGLLRSLRGRDASELGGGDLLRAVGGEGDAVTLESGRPLAEASWVDACCHVMLQLARALEHAHGQGVLHRDLKPSNVMLTAGVRVLLLDFGLASTRGTSRLTRTGSQVGSLPYMAPEQLRGQAVDERTDLYAIGVTLYELLCLRLPYFARDPEETRRRILEGVPRPPSEENPALSWDAETVCLTAMERDPARRYPSARALADDLRAVLRRMPIAARRPGPWLRARRFAQRNPASSTAVALGALIVAGSVAFGVREQAASRALTRALDGKDAALQEARGGFLAALEATNEMLREVGAVDLRDVPRADELRRALLADAARFYEDLLARHPEDPELRRAASTGFTARATLLLELGDVEGADASLTRAFDLLEGLRTEHPLDPVVLSNLALSFRARTGQLFDQGNEVGAVAAARRTIELRREVVGVLESRGAEASEVREHRRELATDLSNLGGLLQTQHRLSESIEMLLECRRVLEELAGEAPVSTEANRALAMSLAELGVTLWQLGRLDESRAAIEPAIELLDGILQAQPEDLEALDLHARLVFNLSWLIEDGGDPERAFQLAERCLRTYTELAREYPTRFDPASLRIRALNRTGGIRYAQGRLAEAAERFEEALQLTEEMLTVYPDLPDTGKNLVDSLTNLGMHRLAIDEHGEAEDLLRCALDELEVLCARHPSAFLTGLYRNRATLLLARTLLAKGDLGGARSLTDAEDARTRAQRDGTLEREQAFTETLIVLVEIAAAQGDRSTVVAVCRDLHSARARASYQRRAAGLLLTAGDVSHGLPAEILELALDLLELSRESGEDAAAEELSAADDLRALRGHPRFQELIARGEVASRAR